MKNFLYVCLAIVCVGAWVSCKSQKFVVATFSDLNGEWNVVELNGKKVNPAETHQFLVLDTDRKSLSGNAGCNRMMGKIEYSESQKNIIKFPNIATTRMACPDMSGEQTLLEALGKVVRFQAVGDTKPVSTIALYGTDNTLLMTIQKK